MILWIAVVISDPFTAQVIVSTQYSSRHFLRRPDSGCRDKAGLYTGSRMIGKTQLPGASMPRRSMRKTLSGSCCLLGHDNLQLRNSANQRQRRLKYVPTFRLGKVRFCPFSELSVVISFFSV